MPRERLPNRRRAEHHVLRSESGSMIFTIGIGRFADGRPAELFISTNRPDSPVADSLRDGAVVVSIALQHGAPIAELRAAITRGEDGSPASLLGQAIDLMMRPPEDEPEGVSAPEGLPSGGGEGAAAMVEAIA